VRKILAFFVLVLLAAAVTANSGYAQANNGSVGGVVQDSTKALIPGVTITLTNTQTGVVDSKLTNESGAYSFPSVLPGTYKLTGDLTGFRQAVQNAFPVGTTAQIRIDLVMQVGAAPGEVVSVVTSNENSIQESAASVGNVLTEQRVRDLPIVGNNVLDLLSVLPGFRAGNTAIGGAGGGTVGGMGLDSVNATINGLSTNSSRDSAGFWGYQTFTTTVVNPDLVGEIRLILAPVDAELGRGNAQVQIQTRSGTNKYTGSAVWNVQNTALNANSWLNNHTSTLQNGVPISNSTKPDWRNIQEASISVGGPIKKNKTFFFVLYDQQFNNSRTLITNTVWTDTARQGIFRYFEGWNPGNAAAPLPTSFTNSTTATYPVVDFLGNPVAPAFNPNGSPYTGNLRCFSVFGNIKADGSPFTSADCQGGIAVLPNNGIAWDPQRPNSDTTGYVQRILSLMPKANHFGLLATANGVSTQVGDGLNTAAQRWLRPAHGSTSTNASIGVVQGPADYNNRKQINLKNDHNINNNPRVNVQWTYEAADSVGTPSAWEGGPNAPFRRRPEVFTANGTSTITANLVNEARFGVNYSSEWASAPWANLKDPESSKVAQSFLIPGGTNPANGKVYPIQYTPGANATGFWGTGFDFANTSPLWDYSDTLRWSHGKHSFSFGGEYRRPMTTGFNNSGYPTSTTGNPNGATAPPMADLTKLPELVGFVNGPNNAGGGRSNAINLTYLLNGSLATASTAFWLDAYDDVAKGVWKDTTTAKDIITTGNPDYGHQARTQISNEWSFFAKDDYKIHKRLTLNLGLRWDENFSPYLRGGLTNKFQGDGAGLYGAGRPTSGDILSQWMVPGNLYITGYGTNPTTAPLSCQVGVVTPGLPASTCDPALMSTVEFVGPGSNNPKDSLVPENGQFSPAIGFAWQVPWFGDGQTTMRGGFQRTYGGAGSNFSGGIVSGYGGDSQAQGLILTDPKVANILATRALNLTDLQTLIPTYPVRAPGVAIPIANRINGGQAAGYAMYDPNYVTPYTDNFTLSITRSIGSKYTIDLRFVDTLGKKQPGTGGGGVGAAGSFNLNTVNVYHNPELFNALEATRAGLDDPLFDQMLMGLNLNSTVAGYGVVGTCVALPTSPLAGVGCPAGQVMQRGSSQIRRAFATALANGDYQGVLNGVGATPGLLTIVPTGLQGLPIDPSTGQLYSGAAQVALRNGCNRIANGLTTGFTINGTTINPRCFPENYIITNPQLTQAQYAKNLGHTNYQSGQFQFTARPIQGVSIQGTYSFSKTMAQPGNGFTDPLNPQFDYGVSNTSVGQEFRSNGTFELPVGPNKLLLGNSSGWLARVVEKWQTSFIYTLPTGQLTSLVGSGNMLYANPRPDVVGPWDNPRGDVTWEGVNGSYFGSPSPYASFKDPQCINGTVATTPDGNGFTLSPTTGATSCTLTGLGEIVPAGTPGSIVNPDGRSVLPILQNPRPGHKGNLTSNTMHVPSHWTLDANVSKQFRISESKSLQVRVDTINVMNHPTPGNPTGLGNNSLTDNFGQITAKNATAGWTGRQFQGQLRFTF